MTSLTGRTAREYLRVSATNARSIPEQHRDNREAACREGMSLGAPYEDRGSASRYASRERDGFVRLVSDLEKGCFGAGVLILWEPSRGSRRVAEWVELIELCEERGVCIHVTSHGRSYDPTLARDRRSLLDDAVDSEYESAKISDRTRRGCRASALAGKPHGICPFGFQRDYATLKGKLVPVRQYAHPDWAPLVVELFLRTRAGDSFRAIARDWAAKGVKGRRGRPISAETMRDLVLNVAYIGLRTTKGTVVSASWDGLVDDDLFHEVQSIVNDPSRRRTGPGVPRHAFTGVLVCDACAGGIAVRNRRGRSVYVCKVRGCVTLDKEGADEVLTGVVVASLMCPEAHSPAERGADRVSGLRQELARIRAERAEVEQLQPRSLAEARKVVHAAERLERMAEELEDRLAEVDLPSALTSLFPPGGNVFTRWLRLPVAVQREIAALLFVPGGLGRVRVRRSSSPGQPGEAGERLAFCHST